MEIVTVSQKRTLTPTKTTIIHEYDTKDEHISGAVAEIRGRYPDHGFVINQKIKEIAYVLSGQGSLFMQDKETPLSQGDIVFLDHGEKFAWMGDMVLFMATTPQFDPDQHIIVE